ncbi:MAG: hypothetical protein CM15mP59_2100 [Flavobacteriaceae bacterium]|nr:MAG: hypothetical protein CM15mP59_2100 [Flavobacteriaceae bacterium]
MKLAQSKTTLLVVGGSLGSKRMNELMAVHCDRITQMGVQIVWQCGSLIKKNFCQLQKNNVNSLHLLMI